MMVDVLVVLRVQVETDDDEDERDSAEQRAVEQAAICADLASAPSTILNHVRHIDARTQHVAVIRA